MRKTIAIFALLFGLLLGGRMMAQMPGGEPVVVSSKTQTINGKRYYVHIVQRGQTVYSIARAYGLKEHDAVIKTDVSRLSIGDTVWLPVYGEAKPMANDNKVSVVKPDASVQRTPVAVSTQVQTLNGQRYYVHVVQKGQTVYSITRAYGLKEYDAVVKKDIHFLEIGDTVWLPCRNAKIPSDAVVAQNQGNRGGASSEAFNPSDTAIIRQRVSSENIVISLMMPLCLDQMSSISTTKFDIEQRGKTNYKSFEFIQFYEGIMMGLNLLQQQGVNITLNVVDVPDNKPETVDRLFASHHVAESDVLIALLTRQPFACAAELARQNNLMIVNPIATRDEILNRNPYVFKCSPSEASKLSVVFDMVQARNNNSHIILVHSGGNSDKALLQMATQMLDQREGMSYSVLGWAANTKLKSMLVQNPNAVVLSLYNVDASKNRIFVSQLLNKLSADKEHPALLVSLDDWTRSISDVDYNQLQQLSYHTFYTGWDYTNAAHIDFLQQFREQYKTEPVDQYAAIGNDIAIYFASGLNLHGSEFWHNPVLGPMKGMLFPMSFAQKNRSFGFENNAPRLYRLENFVFTESR